VKSLTVFGPAPVNLSDTTGHYMWSLGEIGMNPLCAMQEAVTLDLTITPTVPAGCTAVTQQILPGRNPFYLMSGEQKWVLYRTRFECHDPALEGIYPLNVKLCIDHVAHVPASGDDLNQVNDCQSRAKSLLIDRPVPAGTKVLSINHGVTNDCNSGEDGQWWALDAYTKTFDVYALGGGNYYAIAGYNGIATTIIGQDPPGLGDQTNYAANIPVPFWGGYVATFTGTLKAVPCKATSGNIGSFNYGGSLAECTAHGGPPDPFDWQACYFDSVSGFAQPYWGWAYDKGNPPSCEWLNASTGNSGNILYSCGGP